MDTLAALASRRSIKRFAEQPVPRESLEKLLQAAYDAPSGANKHPRQFIVVTGREALDRLAGTHPHCGWLKSAQAAIAILGEADRSRYWLEDCCVAAQNVWIAATALGIGLAWGAMYQSDDAEETARREAVVREVLGIPTTLRVPIVLGLGLPAAPVPERKRPALETMVYWERYGRI
ncbi:MAG: nitroreductase family protein [Chloroflexi bacterium]|nr:nitroreductase family protein [Chloroflexota bacterium]